jgi:hypothetical protein
MKLEGSCQCGKVRFTVESDTPYPYMYCFCSICRKLGGAGFGCNIMGRRDSLRVTGRRHLREYHARIRAPGKRTRLSQGERWFCGECGAHLWVADERWPDSVWPNAAAIDTPLPRPPQNVFIMTRYRAAWSPLERLGAGPRFPEYPGRDLSIEGWHRQHGLHGVAAPVRSRRPSGKRSTAPTMRPSRRT